jgi:broad specificity phosphatase PhoE
VTEVLRLCLVSHAMTDAMGAGHFPADEPLNAMGRRQLDAVDPGRADRTYCGPELRTRQTAELLGLRPEVQPRLADLDHGRWRGTALDDHPASDVAAWLTDPTSAPHGGESVVGLIGRISDWMVSLPGPGRVVAVTHPAVVRAAVLVALQAPPKSFWRIDVAPASRTVLHCRGQSWTLRVAPKS